MIQKVSVNEVGYIIRQKKGGVDVHFLKANKDLSLQIEFLTFFDIELTGDTYPKKICDRCFRLLPTTAFEDNRIKKGGAKTKRPSCKECREEKNGLSISTTERRKWNEERPANYSLFTCPICNKRSIVGITKIVLDHNHKTGCVRGWLCESCNTGIGRFDDDPKLVERAKFWLLNTPKDTL